MKTRVTIAFLRRFTMIGFACVKLVVLTADAQAMDAKEQRADALFSTARQLLEGRQYELACPKLEESQRLDPAVGTLLYLAFCYEMTERLGLAWSTYRAAQVAAEAQGQRERAKIAQIRAALIEPNLTRLRVATDCLPKDAKVSIDGVTFGRNEATTGLFVEAGRHQLLVGDQAPKIYEEKFETRAGIVTVIKLDCARVARLGWTDIEGDHIASTSTSQLPAALNGPKTARFDTGDGVRLRRWFGIASGAVGVASLGIATAYAIDSAAKSDDAEKYRRPGTNIYDEPGYSLNREALESRTIAIVGFAISGLALGGATILLWPRASGNGIGRDSNQGLRLSLAPQSLVLAARWQ